MMSWIAAIQANNNPDEDVSVFSIILSHLSYYVEYRTPKR